MDIREFLEARLADDQKIAEDAYAMDDGWPFWIDVDDEHHYRAACTFRESLGPARVLRDVEAKRALLAWHDKLYRLYQLALDGRARQPVDPSAMDGDVDVAWAAYRSAVMVLRIEAARWSDHPDYDPSWSPS